MSEYARDDPNRVKIGPGGFVISREYDMFADFCDAVRRYRWLAVCTGEPGVGKTTYAERYTMWDVISPDFPLYAYSREPPPEAASCPGVYYRAQVTNTPKQLTAEIERRRGVVSYVVDAARRIRDGRDSYEGLLGLEDRTELLVLDEAQRLNAKTLEQLRDIHDEGSFGLVLMSATPRFARVLSGNAHYRARIGDEHVIEPLKAAPARKVIANPGVFGVRLPPEAFSEEDAVSAMVQMTHGNLGRLKLLVQQVELTLKVNDLPTGPGAVTVQVVESAAVNMGYSVRPAEDEGMERSA